MLAIVLAQVRLWCLARPESDEEESDFDDMDGILAYATSTKLLCKFIKLSDSLLSLIFCSKTVHRPNDFRPRGGKPMPELMRNFTCDRPLNCVAIRPSLLGCTPKLAPADSTDVNDLLCLTLINVMQCHPVLQHKVGNGNFVHGCPGQTSCCSFNHSDLQIGFQADLPASCYTGDSSHFFSGRLCHNLLATSAICSQDAEGGGCMLLAGGGQDARDVALVGVPWAALDFEIDVP